MVDPNRKINHLSEEDVKFLNECENEFKVRYTEGDEEYKTLCNSPISEPPIISPWMTHRSSNAGSSNYQERRPGNYNQRSHHHRSNRPNNRNYYNKDGDDNNRRGTKRPYKNDGNDYHRGAKRPYNNDSSGKDNSGNKYD